MPSNPYGAPQVTKHSSSSASRSKYAACPNCQAFAAQRVSWTFWGGALGPKMFTHVKCSNCNTKYNGKTGGSNQTNILVYLVVSIVLGLALVVAVKLLV